MVSGSSLPLLQGIGLEMEYMIVDEESLAVLPVSDEVLKAVSGDYRDEVKQGTLSWSNELVLHVLELKTSGPVGSLAGLHETFQENVRKINRLLEPLGGRLMPTAMHPWMDPSRETRLWPHERNVIYETYHRIFGCQGHGWSNLQSTHLNLSFATDEEFSRLHAAVRLVLPLLPALAASSPIQGGRRTGALDSRLIAYQTNSSRVPSVTGRVIPEPVFDPLRYREEILGEMYRDISPLDTDHVLQYEWLNSRGAIARFERNTIEIRLLDVQECPLADVAVCELLVETVRALTEERWVTLALQKSWATEDLVPIYQGTVSRGEEAQIDNDAYLEVFGMRSGRPRSAQDLWEHILTDLNGRMNWSTACRKAVEWILRNGTLATRILQAVGENPSDQRMASVYGNLCDCLQEGRLFGAST